MQTKDEISVIIPTVQKKLKVLSKLVDLLQKDSCVSEILIINNKPEIPLLFNSSAKLRIITPEQNLYVCASWNMGIREIENEQFAIINDDILFCPDFCSMVVQSDVFNSESTGLIGLDNSSICKFQDVQDIEIPSAKENQAMEFSSFNEHLLLGNWASVLFGKKSNYYTIPEDFKIIYGDNYLAKMNKLSGKTNYKISNLPINHIHSSSSASPEFLFVVGADIRNYNNSNDFDNYIK